MRYPKSRISRTAALTLLVTLSSAVALSAKEAPGPTYNRDIRPILAENCFACHGPDKAARKGDLRLDIREEVIKSGAIVPGKPAESSFIERLETTNARQLMPPPKTHKKLTAQQKATLRKWVEQGAEYQAHWSFLAPAKPDLPQVKTKGWARNPIDYFVLTELEKRGLKPAPEADRRTLARRLSLDLRGLPPTIAEVEAFVSDKSKNAYEKYVEKLMASPQWGEHRGRYWLDAARFADTHGIHFDNFREMWAYRDWVINAFNKNQRFDQFTIEQLAGDLLPNRSLEQQVATGFNRCNITTNEGGVIPEEYLVLYTRDRTETASQVWMGLTMNCAVCHDHKLDPLTMKDFYSLAAFFNNTTQNAMDGNIKDTPPVVTVPRPQDRQRYVTLVNLIGEARRRADERKAAARADFGKWLAGAKPEAFDGKVPTDGLVLHGKLSEGEGSKVKFDLAGKERVVDLAGETKWDKGHLAEKAYQVSPVKTVELPEAGDFDKGQAFTVSAWVKLPAVNVAGAFLARMDEGNDFRGWDLWLENGRVGMHLVNKWPGDAIKVVATNPIKPKAWTHVLVSYDGSGKAAGVKVYLNGAEQKNRDVQADTLKSTTRTKVPLKLGTRHTGNRLNGLSLQDVRIYNRALPDSEVMRLGKTARLGQLVAKGKKLSAKEKDELFDWWLSAEDKGYPKLLAAFEALKREEDAIKARGTVAHVSQEKGEMAMAHILFRGEYDKRRDKVDPSTPKALPPMPKDLPRNRLGLARWLTSGSHPLTARVTVNRFWQEVFGRGIVPTAGDFGIAGELPSHPELLDWLALDFQADWDVKRFFHQVVTSATYRQAAVITSEKREKDRDNVWLSRGPRYRMDGEMIRDYALSASGLLVEKLGGPSVKPYQPDGVWEAVAMDVSNTRIYRRDTGEGLYRRSMYTFWKRAAPPASMEIFNAPNRETCVVKRERTNTPTQALVTLNDEQFVEAARALAERVLKKGGTTPEERLEYLARTLLARPFRDEERPVVKRLLGELLAEFQAKPDEAKKLVAFGESKADPKVDAKELAGWTMLVNSLLNLDEVLNK
ncbi:MAG: DUF1553 domain-containing protein [Gemmataceae bacterium]